MNSRDGRDQPANVMSKKNNERTGLMKLFEDQLADLYYVEKQLLRALPRMAKKARNEDLVAAFTEHRAETEGQVARLEEIFVAIGKTAKAKKCPAIDGILEEGKEIMEEFADDPALDAGLVSAAQKVEHYEITSYGSLKAWAEQLELTEVAALIQETMDEEKAADEKLSEIAETVVNIEADEDAEGARTGAPARTAVKKSGRKAS